MWVFSRITPKEAALLLFFFVAVYLLPLGVRPLLAPDETRYAEVPREMVASGDWVVPRLDGMRYFEKPPLGYWLTAASLLLLGENDFAVRLPSVLAVGLTVLLMGLFLRSPGGSLAARAPTAGPAAPPGPGRLPLAAAVSSPVFSPAFLAGLVYLSCGAVMAIGSIALLDNPLTLFLSAALLCFFQATECEPGSGRERGLLLLSGTACGLAFLTKGFLAFVVPGLVIVAYLVGQRRWRDLWRMAGLPLLAALLVALPWGVLIHLREPDFWNYFFWHEHIHRFFSARAQHAKPAYFFLLAAPVMFLPWSLLLPALAGGAGKRFRALPARERRRLRFAWCWLLAPFLFFSLSRGKLATYILPCFPAAAILAGYFLALALDRSPRAEAGLRRGLKAGVAFYLLLFAGLFCGQFLAPARLRPYHHPLTALLLAGGLATAALLLALALRRKTGRRLRCVEPAWFRDLRRRGLVLFALASGILLLSFNLLPPDLFLARKAPGLVFAAGAGKIAPGSVIIADKRVIRAACWYLERDDIYLLGGRGELKYGISYPTAAARHLTDVAAVRRLIAGHPGRVCLVGRSRDLKAWLSRLPHPRGRCTSGPDGYTMLFF